MFLQQLLQIFLMPKMQNAKAASGSLPGFRLLLSAGQGIGTAPQPRPSV